MTYSYFKDSPRRAVSDKVLQDKALDISKNQEHDGYQRGLVSKSVTTNSGRGINPDMAADNQQLAIALVREIIRTFK